MSIAGVIARVQVHQVFENTGSKPDRGGLRVPGVDARRGARHAHEDRRARDRGEDRPARRRRAQSYEAARREGKRASLLEQERPNVFTMNVANIMPGDRIEVEMDYSEMLVPEEAIYEFVYPTVVGPRYAGGADPVKDKWMANPHLPAGTPEPYRFDIKVHLETGIALKELTSPSHQVTSATRRPDARRRDAGACRAAATATSCCATGWRATRSRAACCCGRARAAAAAARTSSR